MQRIWGTTTVAWSKRRSKAYYYRKVRTAPGCWEKQYVGGGPSAEAAAHLDSERKKMRAAERHRLHEECDRFAAAAAAVWRLNTMATTLTRAAMILAEYHRHDRGSWRKRRVKR